MADNDDIEAGEEEAKKESNRFIKSVQKLKFLKPGQLYQLNIEIKKSRIKRNLKKGIF